MVNKIVRSIFNRFDWNALGKDGVATFEEGIVKHRQVLRCALLFLLPQAALCILSPELFLMLSICSFIALLFGSAWYNISFQNVSLAQLVAGVATYITKRMFRAFLLSFDTLPLGIVFFMTRALVPEIVFPTIDSVHISIRVITLALNIWWVLFVWKDVYTASVGYDAADSLLGDGFPTLMRGARSTAQNLPVLDILRQLLELQKLATQQAGVSPEEIEAVLKISQDTPHLTKTGGEV